MTNKRLFLLMAATSIFVTACAVYGPNAESKSPIDILSEKNYNQTGSVLGVSILKSKKRNTVIEGIAYASEIKPLKFEKLRLVNSKGETVSETTTRHNGRFEFKDYILNGKYLITIESEKFSGEIPITVDDFLIRNIIISATPDHP